MNSGVAEVSPKYLAEAASNDVPVGYKQTEVGVIPEDWLCEEIGSFKPFITSGSRGWAAYYSKFGSPFVRITNTTRKSIYLDLSDTKYVLLPDDSSEGRRTSLENGDVLISITADIGICSYVDDRLEKPAFINQHIALVRFDSLDIDSKFVAYYLSSENVQKLFRSGSDQGAKAGMNLEGVRKIHFAVPPKPEQTAIANALSDVDALISELEKLIAKKQAIKTATMQQLLTGHTRLPQFALREDGSKKGTKPSELGDIPEDWEVGAIGDSCRTYSGGTPSTSNKNFYGGGIKWITSSDLNQGVIHDVAGRITDAGLNGSSAKLVEAHTLLIALYGATAGVCAITRISAAINQAVLAIVPAEHNSEYLFYWFTRHKEVIIETYTQGGQPNLSGDIVRSIKLAFPPVNEQTAIATILSDMDEEIQALEQRLSKTRQIKQGMMQELLTGKTRLIKPSKEVIHE
ncbi:restriction endonuclease subunit S [Vibrio cholerae]|nr:restriction endonuclease subunit S [Vibrio cholerae]EJL6364548.1 restriction endonuclease subunit S [Vibrio cholerae]EKF9445017.1 restriction endonuclease subunit S [Vibrio cholerae]ELM0316342.1 restriction endonuclease subunit S [Vibrio cholerae]